MLSFRLLSRQSIDIGFREPESLQHFGRVFAEHWVALRR
jgi:hypothetical protein